MAEHNEYDKGGLVGGAKTKPTRFVAAAGNMDTNNDARLSETVGELHRQFASPDPGPNAAGGPGQEYGQTSPKAVGRAGGSSYRKGG